MLMFPKLLSVLSLLVVTQAIVVPPNDHTIPLHRRANLNPTPVASGSVATGWQGLPPAVGAAIRETWQVGGHDFPVYQSTGLTKSDVKRAIIVFPGKPRDCWNYWNLANNAVILAAEKYPDVSTGAVSVLSPCFLTEVDLEAGAAHEGQLLFGLTTWISGQKSVSPEGVNMSSYEVVDRLVDYYLDTEKYPNLETVVIAGHSAGAQMAQRYAAMRKSTENDAKIHYYVGNPGSILWLTEDRPRPDAACEGFDRYKYGFNGSFPAYSLGNANNLGRDGLVDRYLSRNIHYAWGLNDHGAGDTRCQAVMTGTTHLERGQNFEKMLNGMGGIPATQTIDYVEGVSHNSTGMFLSDQGLDKLVRYPYST